jgi:hypothetical protein
MSGRADEEQSNTGEVDEGFVAERKPLVVAAESSGAAQPGEGAFHHPAPRPDMKAGRNAQVLQEVRQIALELTPPRPHHFQLDAQALSGPLAPGTGVAF